MGADSKRMPLKFVPEQNRPLTDSNPAWAALPGVELRPRCRFGSRASTSGSPMSASGHWATSQGFRAMSALPRNADLRADIVEVCRSQLGAKSRHRAALLDHLVGPTQHHRRHGKSKRFGGVEINEEFEFGRALHRKISGRSAIQNTVHVTSCTAKCIELIWSICQQAAVPNE